MLVGVSINLTANAFMIACCVTFEKIPAIFYLVYFSSVFLSTFFTLSGAQGEKHTRILEKKQAI